MIYSKLSRKVFCAFIITFFTIVGASGFALAEDSCQCFTYQNLETFSNSLDICQYAKQRGDVSQILLSDQSNIYVSFVAMHGSPPLFQDTAYCNMDIFTLNGRLRVRPREQQLTELTDGELAACQNILNDYYDTHDCEKF